MPWVSESEIQASFIFSQRTTLDFGRLSAVNWYFILKDFSVTITWTHSTRNLTIRPQSKGVRETFRYFGRVLFIVPCAVWVDISQSRNSQVPTLRSQRVRDLLCRAASSAPAAHRLCAFSFLLRADRVGLRRPSLGAVKSVLVWTSRPCIPRQPPPCGLLCSLIYDFIALNSLTARDPAYNHMDSSCPKFILFLGNHADGLLPCGLGSIYRLDGGLAV